MTEPQIKTVAEVFHDIFTVLRDLQARLLQVEYKTGLRQPPAVKLDGLKWKVNDGKITAGPPPEPDPED